MMSKHYAALSGATEDVQMPFELSGMHVDRKPPAVHREPAELSGMSFELPPIQPRPAPAHLTPQYPPPPTNLGAISKPKTSRRPLGGAILYAGGFAILAGIVYATSKFLREED